jgi:hypothetical protein
VVLRARGSTSVVHLRRGGAASVAQMWSWLADVTVVSSRPLRAQQAGVLPPFLFIFFLFFVASKKLTMFRSTN